MSGDVSGSLPSQSRHWNLRPPVFVSKNRIALWHLVQVGGGVFLGIGPRAGIGREYGLTVTECCRGRSGDQKTLSASVEAVCRVTDSR